MPIMLPMRSKGMVLLQLRDPVVQARVGVAEYVASDYDMNAACSSKEFIDGAFILTGPNMGGTIIKPASII